MANKGPNKSERYSYLICACRDHSHTVRAGWDTEDSHPTVWVSFGVKSEPNLLKRLKNAFNYLLGRHTHGDSGDVVWDATIVPQLREIIKFLEKK